MAKAKHCNECRFFRRLIPISRPDLLCEKGHRPKFYKPANLHAVIWSDSWGWKRRCDDFILGDHVQVISQGAVNDKG